MTEEEKYQEWKLLGDILSDLYDDKNKLEITIEALKTNPEYRALHKKDYLPNKEKELIKTSLIIKSIEYYKNNH